MSKFLVTGAAGFIGFHLVSSLIKNEDFVFGLDNINDYYDVNLKYARLRECGINSDQIAINSPLKSEKWGNYRFIRMSLEDKSGLMRLFEKEKFDYVVNLAAQAGVRYSIDNPDVYIQSNITGFFNILEACRHYPVKFLLYASSSSVYGDNIKTPFSETDNVDHPISLYAATKKSNELMAFTYSHLYKIPLSGLRFFTVYGPWGRPDMAVYKFTEAILNQKVLQVYGNGTLMRDFTFIDDIIDGINKVLEHQASSRPPEILNIGNNHPVTVNALISEIETCLGIKSVIKFLPIQPGDVKATFADINRINDYCNFKPRTNLKAGIKKYCDWHLGYTRYRS